MSSSFVKTKVPELGSSSMGKLTLPSDRLYLVWKEKANQFMMMVGMLQPFQSTS